MNIQPLHYKEDWPQAVERLTAWWQGEIIDRACVQVFCPANRRSHEGDPPAAPEDRRWLDTDWLLDQAEQRVQRTAYVGEAFPCYWPNIGPETLAGYLGCEIEFGPRTSWTRPLPGCPAALPSGQDWPELKFDPNNAYYQFVKRTTAAAMQRFAGKIIVGMTDFHNAGDTLAAIRDPQQLCLDLIERPDRVVEAVRFLRQFRKERFAENVEWTRAQGGTTTWLSGFSTGVYACTQIDFIVLISPTMFGRFFLDELNAAGRDADHVMYHLDGPGELKHLDALLAMDNLHAIQWVPGAGGKTQVQWIDLLRRIRQAGAAKSLHLWCDEPAHAVQLVEELGPKGLCLQTSTETRGEADQLVKDIARASAGKK